MQQPFAPSSVTANIDVGASTGRVDLGVSSPSQIRVMNNGTATAWIAFGGSAITATTTASIPVGPGVTEVLTPPANTTHAAAIAAGATGRIYFTPGAGI